MMWTSLLGVQVRFGSKNVRTCTFVIYILTSLKTCSKQLTATPNPPTESVSYWWCQFFLKVSTTLRTWTLPIIYYMVRYYIINNVYFHSNIWLDLWDASPWFENFHDAALIGFNFYASAFNSVKLRFTDTCLLQTRHYNGQFTSYPGPSPEVLVKRNLFNKSTPLIAWMSSDYFESLSLSNVWIDRPLMPSSDAPIPWLLL